MTAFGVLEASRIARLAPVLRRHTLAMKVVKNVNDENARWLLLDHVVSGCYPNLDRALASPLPAGQVALSSDLAQAA